MLNILNHSILCIANFHTFSLESFESILIAYTIFLIRKIYPELLHKQRQSRIFHVVEDPADHDWEEVRHHLIENRVFDFL